MCVGGVGVCRGVSVCGAWGCVCGGAGVCVCGVEQGHQT